MSRTVYSTPEERRLIIDHLRSVPANYPVCHRSECPLRDKCLRHQEWLRDHNKLFLMQVNPMEPSLMTDSCRHFRDSRPVTYALGFVRQYNRMSTEQKRSFRSLCCRSIARTNFYYELGAHRPIPPEEQAFIRKCAQSAGFDFPQNGFDTTFSAPGW